MGSTQSVQGVEEEEEQVDIQKVLGEIAELEKNEAETKKKLNEYLKELGFDVL